MAEYNSGAINSVDTPAAFGQGQDAIVRRWMVELSLAKKRMKPWHDRCKKLWDLYHGSSVGRKKNSYNCLYANTEILAPAVYNSLPQPDVRRRFGDTDALGKAIAEVMNRSLMFQHQTTDFDTEIRYDVLEMLVLGRGISRVRYVPDLVQVGDTAQTGKESDETQWDHEAQEGEQNEELAWENAPIEHVAWDKYLCGPGRTFKEIPWWAFRHDLNREELIRRFGKGIGNTIPLNGGPDDPELQRVTDDQTMALFKTAEIWEIWDKESRTVIWVCQQYPKNPCKTEEDPLELDHFFPLPEPLRALDDSDTFNPTALYDQYREQAEELDRISTRINKLVDACKARAIYDPSLGTQISELFRGADNDLVPAAESVRQLYENGGIEKAIWFAPIEQIVAVVKTLYEQRAECKQVIFELTGIADIMRGATDPAETYGAQALKTQFGMTRLARMQRAVQRYIRDIIRLQAQVICNKFGLDTLRQMTALPFPTQAQVAMQQVQLMMAAQTARAQGQQPPPMPPKPITWEDIDAALKNDLQRTFKVDIETDSTIAAIQQEDASDLETVISALVQLTKEVGPLVQMGILPFPAFKEMMLMVARKFRMGNAVEDAIETMQPPPKGQPPLQLQVEQLRQQGKQAEIAAETQAAEHKAALDAQTAQAEQQAQAAQAAQETSLEAQRNQLQMEQDAALERMRAANEMALERFKAEMQAAVQQQTQAMQQQFQLLIAVLNNRAKVEVAEVAAGAQLAGTQIAAANAASAESENA
ncbi:hypothetical protein [Candidimonas nitroreducens]|uniref:Portal protein n=1 Tax=Candidimonas nitroreducens TaxID=683354 RepID=A0A225MNS2_9BURK|nr:hypothetical protein [Candidimonas nitroreducens]OWT62013.1 hypothetical protein CEY11_09410 [Candidimonas nitroreducens]